MASLNLVEALRSQYAGGVMYGELKLHASIGGSLNHRGFMGSANVVSLLSNRTITLEAPGCIAAPLVHMAAKKTIGVGLEGRRGQPVPARICALNQLSMATTHLSLGDLEFVGLPKAGSIACKKLTLIRSGEEAPDWFEIVQSWLVFDNTEREIISRDP